ncbi:MAG: PAS domain S-box protein [Filomicrobium sp.]
MDTRAYHATINHNPEPKIPVRMVLSGAAAALLLAATVLTGLYLGFETQDRFRQIDQSWKAYATEADQRGELLSRIRGHLGYGGFIHGFKNFVLRQEPRYLDQLKARFADFSATLTEYRRTNPSPTELQHLAAIEATFDEYQSKLAIAIQAANEHWDRARTDKLVMVDDTKALKALSELDEFWRSKRVQSSAAIAQSVTEGTNLVTIGFWFLAGLLVVALTLFALFYFLQRELRQTIGLLSKELAEKKLAEHEATKFLRAADQSPSTIMVTDTQGRIEYVNRKFSELTGYQPDEVIGRTPKFLQSGETPQETYRVLRQKLDAAQEWRGNFRNLRKDGSSFWQNTAIFPLRDEDGTVTNLIGVGEDLTERQKAREQIQKAQKLEAIGLLASGVAHDFNNILTTIIGNAHLALARPDHEQAAHQEVEQIDIAARRGRNLVAQLLAFARRQPGKPVPLDVASIVEEVSRLMQASILKNIDLTYEVEDQTLAVFADPTRMHQVLMNLCSNAAEAIGADGGKISIRSSAVPDAEGRDAVVRISVSDTGPGIRPEHLEMIFEPFFTTKGAGKGTGLGLSVVKSLVREMNGELKVSSELGLGTTFEIDLPRTEPVEREDQPQQIVVGGQERILLVDDEAEVADTLKKLLEHIGYQVESYNDPIEAVSVFETEPDRFDLVMTDFVMPEMNGQEVAIAVRSSHVSCPILICTAYQPATLDIESLQPIRLIEKPVDPVKLDREIRTLITATYN